MNKYLELKKTTIELTPVEAPMKAYFARVTKNDVDTKPISLMGLNPCFRLFKSISKPLEICDRANSTSNSTVLKNTEDSTKSKINIPVIAGYLFGISSVLLDIRYIRLTNPASVFLFGTMINTVYGSIVILIGVIGWIFSVNGLSISIKKKANILPALIALLISVSGVLLGLMIILFVI